ncbi:hypothetical protein [Bifidobacterium sp.]|jgi:hypothetical protein|uniref:hypothetical protein n=1 Tax=Bifidobacterium sp. TaxID=41200 RepID=UPI0025BD5BA3|nr:hypothetical protein [Bifidobacterium sp.]MCH4209315.1 hypothetical protein [Bifidobacterium sp.]MCI1224109.1 hypothetical protein [Bifidobacterium sp.]
MTLQSSVQTPNHPGTDPAKTSGSETYAQALGNFSADDSPVNEFGERRFVNKLG